MDLGSVSVHKHAKKELGQYPAILFFNANESTKDIPPSWLHTWSITHTSQPRFSRVGSPYASTPIFNLRVWRFFATYDLWSNTGGTTWYGYCVKYDLGGINFEIWFIWALNLLLLILSWFFVHANTLPGVWIHPNPHCAWKLTFPAYKTYGE